MAPTTFGGQERTQLLWHTSYHVLYIFENRLMFLLYHSPTTLIKWNKIMKENAFWANL